ncbi:MAG: Gfo/Idh/MocA family protein [Actinomycetota bacterium]
MTERPARGVVIGAGAIGCRLADGSEPPQTHAAAMAASPHFRLAGICDPDRTAAEAAGRQWGCPAHADLARLLSDVRPQVAAVAVPAAAQPAILDALLDAGIRAVVAEKPLAPSLAEAERLTRRYADAGVPLLVNFSRRFVPLYRELAERFRHERVLTASIRYAKGLRHNGVHALDLARLLFGEVGEAVALDRRADHWPDDPTVAAFLRCQRCPQVFLQALDERCFTLFELDVVSESGRWIVDGDHRRLRRWEVRDGLGIPPGRRLVEVEERQTGHQFALVELYANLAAVLFDGARPRCGGDEAVAAERLVQELRG